MKKLKRIIASASAAAMAASALLAAVLTKVKRK